MLDEVLLRYTPAQRHEINEFFRVLALRTRKSKRISESRKENILRSWEKYDAETVIDGMRVFMKMKPETGKNEKYVSGIIRNKHKSREAALNERGPGHNNTFKSNNGIVEEGERLKIGKIREDDLECGF